MDVVYPCRFGENPELRYSLRSLANLPHDRVWIFGGAPAWARAAVVPTDQSRTKYANTTGALHAACLHEEVSDPFVLMNDDFYIMRPVPEVPALNRGTVATVIAEYRARLYDSVYLRGMAETAALLERMGFADPLSYELHIPLVVHKEAMLAAIEAGRELAVPHKRTIYGNIAGLGGEVTADVKVFAPDQPLPRGAWLSTDDRTYARVAPLLEWLFPDPSPYESPQETPGAYSSHAGWPASKKGDDMGQTTITKARLYRIDPETGHRRLAYPAGAAVPVEEYEALTGRTAAPEPAVPAQAAAPSQPAAPERTKNPTVAELKARLDELGVEYPAKARLAELTELVSEAEAAAAEADGSDDDDAAEGDDAGDE